MDQVKEDEEYDPYSPDQQDNDFFADLIEKKDEYRGSSAHFEQILTTKDTFGTA